MLRRTLRELKNRLLVLRNKGLKIGEGCNVAGSRFEGYNHLSSHTSLIASELGFCSYVGEYCHLSHARIGRFCSIGSFVRLAIGQHPTREWVSTHPAFFSTVQQSGFTFTSETRFEEKKYADGDAYIIIGNDVWIGNNVLLLPGIIIGDGAIVAAGSVVTKNVEPYSIVGGNPARQIRYRFDEEERTFLLSLQWWNKDTSWIKEKAIYFKNLTSLKEHINEDIHHCK